jgi:signal transduction histidine kinase/CheY-like chemotaxis protein
VLILYWDDRDNPANADFDRDFQAALRLAAPRDVEYYSEYLESTRFPGEHQSLFLRDYIRQKYANRTIDVIVTTASAPLDFLLKYRSELFPHTPIVFAATRIPSPAELRSGAGATGIIYVSSYRRTIDLALKLHPGTEHVFVVSATPSPNSSFEAMARNDLQGFKSAAAISYLTDLPLKNLKERLSALPERSIVLYVWQRSRNQQGKLLESPEVLSLIVPSVHVPIYGMSARNVGLGIVGGYVWTTEANATRLAEMSLKVANGASPADIPVENAPVVPMFDWRQLQRWGVGEDHLPSASIIRFRELTIWQQYRWRIVAAIAVLALQAFLIGALLVERHRSGRTQKELQNHKEHLEQLVQQRTTELVDARDQAVAANQAKSVFLANMSHELRTPLNAILGFSNLLREGRITNRQRHDLDIINRSGEHLLNLINDVLDMAKIDSGRVEIVNGSINLPELVRDVTDLMRMHAREKGLELFFEQRSVIPEFIRGDDEKLRQVLINLLGNAIKYTEQGTVTLRLYATPAEPGALIFEVEDTGIGIAPEDQARIFEAFVQVGKRGSQKGTGLGLAITRRFVKLMRGTIQVESTKGGGSRFRVTLPMEREDSKIRSATPVDGRVMGLMPGQPEYRILIVEDEPENWLLLQRMLQDTGFQVRVAENGEQAVELFQRWRPHFIWMDLRMPVMDGMEAVRRIRALNGGAKVKVAAVTASAFASEREAVLAAGVDDFVRKPYRVNEIFDCLARHLAIQYRFRNAESLAIEQPPLPQPEDLGALPEELRDELSDALIRLDISHIDQVIVRITQRNPTLGSVLGPLASRLAYSEILDAINSLKGDTVGQSA